MKCFLLSCATVIGLVTTSLSLPVQAQVTGAGASFPAPLYAKWASEYKKRTGIAINFQSIGSAAGIKQIDAKTIDFGASDMPLTDTELQRKKEIQFPTIIGGVVPIINIKGVTPGQLRLTGSVLADIYLGKIRRWNDPIIKQLNPQLALPNAAIAVVRRADGSGTTFIFTNYLSKVSTNWKTLVGEGTAVNWPTGTGGKGNEGVSAFVARLPNAIGYVEYAYAKQNKLSYTLLQNSAGVFVAPDEDSFMAAATSASWHKTFYQILTNQGHPDAWPITNATYVLMHIEQDTPQKGVETIRFFRWAYQEGAKMAIDLGYVPMPTSILPRIEKLWGTLKDTAGKPIPLS